MFEAERSRVLRFAVVIAALIGASACRDAPLEVRTSAGAAQVVGEVTERFEAAPYVYLRVRSNDGEVWVAVPRASAEAGGRVRFTKGVPMRDFSPPGTTRKLSLVYFGTIEEER